MRGSLGKLGIMLIVRFLIKKLHNAGVKLTRWNHSIFGNVYVQKKHIHARLDGIQNYLQFNPAYVYHLNYIEEQLQIELIESLLQEEWLRLAKSRVY